MATGAELWRGLGDVYVLSQVRGYANVDVLVGKSQRILKHRIGTSGWMTLSI